jgi:hypothetical protein
LHYYPAPIFSSVWLRFAVSALLAVFLTSLVELNHLSARRRDLFSRFIKNADFVWSVRPSLPMLKISTVRGVSASRHEDALRLFPPMMLMQSTVDDSKRRYVFDDNKIARTI